MDNELDNRTRDEGLELMQSIEEFYLPRHLVKAIYDIGHIPAHSKEGQVGVGFIDIADYTRLSKFLSPKENQILLNGLYTAFQIVLERHGGFLNKIEGDSMMFHFDDIIDKRLWEMDRDKRVMFIARELFYTCVEMQRVCIHFNHADDAFLDANAPVEARQALADAFGIIKSLRSKDDISSTLFAFFQIRIRIGANIGEVTIGNFGPGGSKHWDIIGLPVINAKRMESTAPIGGLRISSEFFDILKESGIADEYYKKFRLEAKALGCVYQDIRWDDLYRFREVVLFEKHNASYKTYSVQVYPTLPESIGTQAKELLKHGAQGANEILEFFRYYRANQYVIDHLERILESDGVVFRKDEILTMISPKIASAKRETGMRLGLYKILSYMDEYLDYVQAIPLDAEHPDFLCYTQFMEHKKEITLSFYEKRKKMILQKTYFIEVVVRLVYASLESSILEHQQKIKELEEPEEAEFL
jgi:class 3 adenylate cyclase